MTHGSKIIRQIAIIRGVEPHDAVAVTDAFQASGFDAVEVPLNSPDPLASIRMMADTFGDTLMIGAGTVLTEADVQGVAEAGGRLVVSPNTNPSVIKETKMRGQVLEVDCDDPATAISILRDMDAFEEVALYGALVHAVASNVRVFEPEIASRLESSGVHVRSMDVIAPSLEDVFISSVRGRTGAAEMAE